MPKLVLASTNKGKVVELKGILAGIPLEIVGLDCFPDAPEVKETGRTFMENAILKARTIGDFTRELTLADDSGLEVDALNGEPGIYSARYGQPGWSDRERYRFLLEKLQGVPSEKRTARFRCAVALYDPLSGSLEQADGKVEGIIIDEPKGINGFGYDPVFYLPELGQTMAELIDTEKNRVSHRARAVKKIIPQIREVLQMVDEEYIYKEQ